MFEPSMSCPPQYEDQIADLVKEACHTFRRFGAHADVRYDQPSLYDECLMQALRDLWYETAIGLGLVPGSDHYWDIRVTSQGRLFDLCTEYDEYEDRIEQIEQAFREQVRLRHADLAEYLNPDNYY